MTASDKLRPVEDETIYRDIDGNECTLDTLCRLEPAWAANIIRGLKADAARQAADRREAMRVGAERMRAACMGTINHYSVDMTIVLLHNMQSLDIDAVLDGGDSGQG